LFLNGARRLNVHAGLSAGSSTISSTVVIPNLPAAAAPPFYFRR